ncbi:(d)CMP kinase [Veillonella criceti]|uniref:Cytidylate kinase n=1 Tax=Veillonella criceti TaxID=103891 RepID=A0A380NH64_9FIRM|nr:(d)CMP kinase [Veillonella criceti]SUP40629.1 Cytidylate kinase [Veillonella criceti]
MSNQRIAVAVDGPAGAGKSSISKVVAKKLGYLYIDTGAMYRAVTWAVLQNGLDPTDESAVTALLGTLTLRLEPTEEAFIVFVNGQDITEDIRSQSVNQAVSQIASIKAVREFLVAQQQAMAAAGGVILDGRDIGSVVLPNAELKIYLTASVEARAKRRWLETKDKESISLETIKKSVMARDEMDMNRKESPLVCVPEAIVVNSDNLSFDETVDRMIQLIAAAEK